MPEFDERQMNGDIYNDKKRQNEDYEVAIIGAGILGTALAAMFGKQGRKVILFERDLSEPDRIVGELLQPGGVAALQELGLRDCLDGIDAIPVYGYEVIYHGNPVNIPYPVNKETGKSPQGRSFHHGKFIMKLREAARKTPNVTIMEATVKDLLKDKETGKVLGVVARRKGGEKELDDHYFASLTVAADGYASNFRKHLAGGGKAISASTFVGLELIDAKLPHPYHGHVLLGNNAPVLLYQIGTHETRALIDIRGKFPSASSGALQNHLKNVVLPDLPKCVQPSFKKALEDAKRFPSMPNSFLPPKRNSIPGFILLGDALNMRHPLTGGGMTVAFKDVVLLKRLLHQREVESLADTDMVLEQMARFHWQRKKTGTSVINILSMALYQLFAADDRELRYLQRGCFAYFQRGGDCIDGPVGLLGGIVDNPWVLFWHFFSVAFYSIYLMWREEVQWRVWLWLWGVGLVVRIFWKACVVVFPLIWSEVW